MTLLAPAFLYASIAVAAVVVGLHFIVLRQPRSSVLPTARFVPDTRATTIDAARSPSDLVPMLLRVITLLAAGAALAKPIVQPSRRAQAKVILIDVSLSVRDSLLLRDKARSVFSDGDAVVLFDSSARQISANAADSLRLLKPSDERGNLSAALVAALRAGSVVSERADRIELVIVSAFAKEEFDAATDSIRALWPGVARLVRLSSVNADGGARTSRIQTNAAAGDPLAVTAALVGAHTGNVFLNRDSVGSATAPAASNSAAPNSTAPISIDWPETGRPRGGLPRNPVDTIGGVVAGDARVIAPFVRRWTYPSDSLRGVEVIARWADGEPAAIEMSSGAGCTRSVAIPVTPIGDLAIRKDFVGLVQSLAGPCTAQNALIAAEPAALTALAGKGGHASRTAFPPRVDVRSPISPWLLGLAVLAAVAELFMRRRGRLSSTSSTLPITPARPA